MCLILVYFTTNLVLLTSSVTSLIVHLTQTLSNFKQDITDAVIDLWHDCLRSHVYAGGRHFKHMLWSCHLCGSSEHFCKLSMQFDVFNDYFVVNIKRWICVHDAFSVFQLSQGNLATLIRWGEWYLYRHICRLFLNLTVKTALKSVDFWWSYGQK